MLEKIFRKGDYYLKSGGEIFFSVKNFDIIISIIYNNNCIIIGVEGFHISKTNKIYPQLDIIADYKIDYSQDWRLLKNHNIEFINNIYKLLPQKNGLYLTFVILSKKEFEENA